MLLERLNLMTQIGSSITTIIITVVVIFAFIQLNKIVNG